jgi:hypothetical protein
MYTSIITFKGVFFPTHIIAGGPIVVTCHFAKFKLWTLPQYFISSLYTTSSEVLYLQLGFWCHCELPASYVVSLAIHRFHKDCAQPNLRGYFLGSSFKISLDFFTLFCVSYAYVSLKPFTFIMRIIVRPNFCRYSRLVCLVDLNISFKVFW